VAKSKDTNAAVTWVHADAAGIPPAGADLAVMTGNVAQVFLTGQDWAQALQAIGAALGPRGYLVFETRRPGRRHGRNGPLTPARSPGTSRAAARSSGAVRSPP